MQHENCLEERSAAQSPFRLELGHHLFERNLLVGEGGESGLPRPGEKGGEGRIPRELGAQGQGVDEQADQLLHLGSRAAGDGRADGKIVLPRVAAEES